MSNYRWAKVSGLDCIYDISGGFIYGYNWNKIILDYIPEKGSSTALYEGTKRIFCSKNNKTIFYYPTINKVSNLELNIEERDIIKLYDEVFFNGKKCECGYDGRFYMFVKNGKELYPKKSDEIIKIKYSRLDKLKKIKLLIKQ